MLDADKIFERIMAAAEEWKVADEKWRTLKEMEPIVLAEITNQADGESFAERRSKALASPEYKLHKTRKITAETERNILLARYKAAQSWSELRRSEESTRRQEMKL